MEKIFVPFNDNVIFRKKEVEQKTQTGIIIGDEAKKHSVNAIGEILSVGVNCLQAEVGDNLVTQVYGLQEIEINGEKLFCVSEKNVIGFYKSN